jgi:hypothetical protein
MNLQRNLKKNIYDDMEKLKLKFDSKAQILTTTCKYITSKTIKYLKIRKKKRKLFITDWKEFELDINK